MSFKIEQLEKFVNNVGQACPYCGGTPPTVEETERGYLWVELSMLCVACGATWTEGYEFNSLKDNSSCRGGQVTGGAE